MFYPGNAASDPPTGPVVLPLRSLVTSDVVVSPSHDCIGRYDNSIFDPSVGCFPAVEGEMFVHGGHMTAFVTLEDADTINTDGLGVSLCVLLAPSVEKFSDGIGPLEHCKRTNGVIDFKGDWCSTTNGPATATCFDAVRFTGDFAASAAVIDP
jgi:hypothetical protein